MNEAPAASAAAIGIPSLLARLRGNRGTLVPLLILTAMIVLLQAVSPDPLNYFGVSTISASATGLALAAVGGTIVVLSGGLDLSVGAVISLVNVVLVTQLGAADISPVSYAVLALAVSLGLGAAIGAVNGFLVGYVRLQSIIVSLATMFIAQGAALLILKYPGGEFSYDASMLLVGDAIPNLIPSPLLVVAVAVASWLYLKATRLGIAVYAVGSDEAAAANNGVSAPATRFWSFTMAGAFYGAAGLFVTANSGSGDPLIGAAMLLKVFAAIVLGGTIIGGGKGGAVGSAIGAFILTILVNIFLVLGIRTYYVPIVEGVVLVLAVLGFSRFRDLPAWDALKGFGTRTARAPSGSALAFSPAPVPAGTGLAVPSWHERNARTLRYIVPAWVLLVLAIAATSVLAGSGFSLASHLVVLLVFGSFLAILGLGQGAVVMSGGLDLSIAWTITFPAIVLTSYANGSNETAVWAVPLALLVGSGVGLVNGLLVVGFRVSPIIATLATGSILEGTALVFSGGAPTGAAPPAVVWFVNGRLAGLPPIVWFLFLFVIAASLLLDRSAFGRRLRAVGQDAWIARLSGVRTEAIRIAVYVLSGFCAALVGVLLAGFTTQAYYDMGRPYLLSSIAVVVLGGTSITGGRGHYMGILGGALLFTALSSMLAGTSLPEAVRSIIYGLVLLGAVLMLRERQSR
jgi:ribose transport system permease protein